MATQIIKSNETSHAQVPMHHRTYTSNEQRSTMFDLLWRLLVSTKFAPLNGSTVRYSMHQLHAELAS